MGDESWNGRRVLVTGHTGFKGSWLSLWLHSLGAEVVGFSDRVPTTPSHFELARVGELVDDRRGDVRDAEAVNALLAATKPEVVFHLAAQSLVRASYADPVGTYETNVLGTGHLLEAVRTTPSVRAVVLVTSDKCYLNNELGCAYQETDALGGHDPYSSSKAAAEILAASFRSSFFSGDGSAQVATARAGNVIGGGDWAVDRLVPDTVRAVTNGEELVVRHPDAQRPWQDVLDCLSGYLLLAEHLLTGPGYAEAWNFGPPPESTAPVRAVLDSFASLWPDGLRWTIDPSPQPHEARLLALDATKARSRLGWVSRRSVEEALTAVVRWHRAVATGTDPRVASITELRAYRVEATT